MKIYFAAQKEANDLMYRYQKVIDILTNAGNSVMSDLGLQKSARFSETDIEKIRSKGETLLEQMDALVIEATTKSSENGYLVALALTHKKPTLFLHQKGTDVDNNLLTLQKQKHATQLLKIISYNESQLEKVLLEFLESVEKKGGKEIPNIKFTLRITPRIERYLHWKTHNTEVSKADFLREKIEKMMDKDEDFKKYNQ